MTDWYPLAHKDIGNSGGSWTPGPWRGLLHTTEGGTYAGALGAYRANNSWPHFTVSYEGNAFGCWQHNPVSVASRSLKHPAGTVETNRMHCIQIEIVGHAATIASMPVGYKDGLRTLMRWIEQNTGIPRSCGVQFKAGGAGVRMNGQQWAAYSGWCGHQHCVSNDHVDPGAIDIGYLLAVPGPHPSPEVPVRLVKKQNHAAVFLSLGGLLIHIPSADLLAAHYAGKPVEELLETDVIWTQPVFGYSGAHIDA